MSTLVPDYLNIDFTKNDYISGELKFRYLDNEYYQYDCGQDSQPPAEWIPVISFGGNNCPLRSTNYEATENLQQFSFIIEDNVLSFKFPNDNSSKNCDTMFIRWNNWGGRWPIPENLELRINWDNYNDDWLIKVVDHE